MKQLTAMLMLFLLLPLVAVGQTAKSEPLFEKAVEKSVVGQYEEAIKLLKESGENFVYPVEWGCDLQTEHERYISEKVFKNTSMFRTPIGDSMAGISSTMALLNMLAVEMPTSMLFSSDTKEKM